MSILAWIVLGLVTGLVVRALAPGRPPGGAFATIVLGIVGSLAGGFVARALTGGPTYTGLTFSSLAWAMVGALVLLAAWSVAAGRRQRRP